MLSTERKIPDVGIVKESPSEWGGPIDLVAPLIDLVAKPDKCVPFCIDLREVNVV